MNQTRLPLLVVSVLVETSDIIPLLVKAILVIAVLVIATLVIAVLGVAETVITIPAEVVHTKVNESSHTEVTMNLSCVQPVLSCSEQRQRDRESG